MESIKVALRRALPWLLVVVAATAAFFLAYIPLEHRHPEALSLALTAAGTVGYAALTVLLVFSTRQQLAVAIEELMLAHQELQQTQNALEAERQAAAVQAETSREALALAHRTYVETVRTRYDAAAPKVVIEVEGRSYSHFLATLERPAQPSDITDQDIPEGAWDHYQYEIRAVISFANLGPTAALVKLNRPLAGWLDWHPSIPEPMAFLLPPAKPDQPSVQSARWIFGGRLDQVIPTLGTDSPFGVRCTFEVVDLLGNTTDSHTLEFEVQPFQRDGSRLRLARYPSANGGVRLSVLSADVHGLAIANVTRRYRDPLETGGAFRA